MKNRCFISIILSVLTLLYISGCNESPVENNYYISGADSLSNPNISPKVIFTNPQNGTTGPFGNSDPTIYYGEPQITVQLNKLINVNRILPNSIYLRTEERDYALELIDGYSGSFSNILVFDFQRQYLAGKTYSLIVDTTLIDIHGKKLTESYIASFIPEPKFRVYYASPSSNGVEPSGFHYIQVVFNSKIDTSILSSFSISPYVNGNWYVFQSSYSDSTTVFFEPEDTLSFNTQYTFAVSSNAKDYNGLPIDKSYQFDFTTAPFRVKLNSYSSYTGPGGFQISNNFSFDFNGKLDTSTVRNSLSISPQISFNYEFFNYPNGTHIRIQFDENEFLRNTTYKITFDSTIRSIHGDILEPYSYSFSTGN